MADQFLGEIRMVPFYFAPMGWALCNGQLLPISQYTALFALIGTYYGGDGRSNFALPNLQGSAPMNQGNGAGLTPRNIGDTGGETSVTLLTNTMPAHSHTGQNGAASNTLTPGSTAIFGGGGRGKALAYAPASTQNAVLMATQALGQSGGGQPHNNMSPYLTLNFVISLTGIFPARS